MNGLWDLKIPVAYTCDKGKIAILAHNATRSDVCYCYGCDEHLVFVGESKDGKQQHFRHKSKSECKGGESIKHYTAKTLLRDEISRFRFIKKCRYCKVPVQQQQYNKNEFDGQCEIAWKTYRIDTGLLHKGRLYAALEVKHTHAVPSEKAAELETSFGEHYFEVESEDVLRFFREKEGSTIDLSAVNKPKEKCKECKERQFRLDEFLRQEQVRLEELRRQEQVRRMQEIEKKNIEEARCQEEARPHQRLLEMLHWLQQKTFRQVCADGTCNRTVTENIKLESKRLIEVVKNFGKQQNIQSLLQLPDVIEFKEGHCQFCSIRVDSLAQAKHKV